MRGSTVTNISIHLGNPAIAVMPLVLPPSEGGSKKLVPDDQQGNYHTDTKQQKPHLLTHQRTAARLLPPRLSRGLWGWLGWRWCHRRQWMNHRRFSDPGSRLRTGNRDCRMLAGLAHLGNRLAVAVGEISQGFSRMPTRGNKCFYIHRVVSPLV